MPKSPQDDKSSSAQFQLQALQSEVARLADTEKRPDEIARLQSQLDALGVAYEELELQNDELQTTREALEHQRHRYRQLFDEAPFGYLVTDANGVIEEANRAAAALMALPQDHLTRKPLAVYLHPEERAAFRSFLSRVCVGEPGGELEIRLTPRNGAALAVVVTAECDREAQGPTVRLRWTVRDISTAKAAEEALRATEERLRHAQRLEAVGRLAGGIAHSFNNLLAAISFQCELLADALPEDDRRRPHVEEIQHAGERAASLARQLLAYGRKQTLQPRVLRLNDVLGEIEPMLRRLIGEHIALAIRRDPAEGAVHVDLGQLEQVILNLAVNARDAMPSGGQLEIGAESVEIVDGEPGAPGELPAGGYVRLTVRDTGGGMPPEAMAHLFEPFFTTKERGKGTGLGLATVHGIVHQSGGGIQVESDGTGTRFFILLPRAAEGSEAVAVRAPIRRATRRGTEVVLLVEDEDNIREPAIEILESRGYHVLSAPDAVSALTVAEEHPGPINLLVTDVVMPGLSGNHLAERLVARRPDLKVLYISGYPEDAIAHHGVLAADQHFLQKPFPPGQFLEKIREVLDARGVASTG